jgi:uncharacterized membrane protein
MGLFRLEPGFLMKIFCPGNWPPGELQKAVWSLNYEFTVLNVLLTITKSASPSPFIMSDNKVEVTREEFIKRAEELLEKTEQERTKVMEELRKQQLEQKRPTLLVAAGLVQASGIVFDYKDFIHARLIERTTGGGWIVAIKLASDTERYSPTLETEEMSKEEADATLDDIVWQVAACRITRKKEL